MAWKVAEAADRRPIQRIVVNMCHPGSFARLWRPGPWPHHGEGLSFLPPKPWRPAMSRKLVSLSSLTRTAANPRRNADRSPIEWLAESIRTDGILQNLVVETAGDGLYRVIAGTRRLRDLTQLRDRGDIDDVYKVPVENREI